MEAAGLPEVHLMKDHSLQRTVPSYTSMGPMGLYPNSAHPHYHHYHTSQENHHPHFHQYKPSQDIPYSHYHQSPAISNHPHNVPNSGPYSERNREDHPSFLDKSPTAIIPPPDEDVCPSFAVEARDVEDDLLNKNVLVETMPPLDKNSCPSVAVEARDESNCLSQAVEVILRPFQA